MKIIKDCVVTLKLDVLNERGERVEREPNVQYLHGGYGNIFPRLEEALAGKAAGDKVRLRLSPEEAFGAIDAALVRTEPRSRFPGRLKLGMQFEAELAHDGHNHPVRFRIVKLNDDEVTLDANHPLAGQSVELRCTVSSVRPASADEITHGHAHGPDGPHH